MTKEFHKRPTVLDIERKEASETLLRPKKIGPYTIETLLNQGGMSLLYLGFSPQKTPVVIKVLRPKYLKNSTMTERFLKEAKLISQIHHPNIVQFYDSGSWEHGVYIAMEYIQGISLRQLMQQSALPREKALEFVLQIAHALSHLHAHGIIHRDLKPENILISDQGELKLIDFGVALLEKTPQEKKAAGTPFYMSPEQLERNDPITPLADIYSLGVITYELLVGKSPTQVHHVAYLPSPLKALLEHALQANPALRYQTIERFIADLSAYLALLSKTKEILPSLIRSPRHPQLEISWMSDEAYRNHAKDLNTHQENISSLKSQKIHEHPHLERSDPIKAHASDDFSISTYFEMIGNTLIFAAPEKQNAATLTDLAVLKGLCEGVSAVKRLDVNELAELLLRYEIETRFFFLLLTLDFEKGLLQATGCGVPPLLHLPSESTSLRTLQTSNPLLGAEKNPNLYTVEESLQSNDLLLFAQTNLLPSELLSLRNLPVEQIIETVMKTTTQHRFCFAFRIL